jgi:hypothetical protein
MTQFERETVTALAEIHVGVMSVVGRLDKINGAVSKQQETLLSHEISLRQHGMACPLIDTLRSDVEKADNSLHEQVETVNLEVEKIETDLSEHLTASFVSKRVNTQWIDNLRPVLLVLGGAGSALILSHATELLKFFGK